MQKLPTCILFPGQGQGMAEYTLAGALILIAGVSALALLGKNLNGQLGDMMTWPPKPTLQAGPASTTQSPPKSGNEDLIQTVGSKPLHSPDTIQVKMSDGTILKLNIPNNTSESIVTIGANGTTELLAQSLESLAAQLKSQGKIDEEGSNAILRLANLSHRLARIESVLESNIQKSGGDLNLALNTPVEFEGQTYSKASDLAKLLNTGLPNPDGSFNFGAETSELHQAFSDLWPAGVMENPEIAAIFNTYFQEIVNIADGNRVVIDQMANNYGTPEQYRTQLAQHMKTIGFDNTANLLSQKSGSEITHLDSAQICTAGGNQDTGTNCSL